MDIVKEVNEKCLKQLARLNLLPTKNRHEVKFVLEKCNNNKLGFI